ncbi:hypothetical protein CYY_005434 [Polysphondylium violaceum]|uniref:F-box domain-containing protein n=1 Tax=Polysphondylium violaceum TaxID=133409 RepID=A0A8J4PTH9_9MYCE|nr:hypothetical protein CYY_005434 [Polysphondylium violaceum]
MKAFRSSPKETELTQRDDLPKTDDINYLNNVPNTILKIIIDNCTGAECVRLSMTCKTIRDKMTKLCSLSDSLIPFVDVNLCKLKARVNSISRYSFWKNNYICFPAIKFSAIANRDYFNNQIDNQCVFKEYLYLQYVWWLEMGEKNIKNVPIADYDIYWRIKLDTNSKPIMFNCTVLLNDKVYTFTKGILDKDTGKLNLKKWCIYKTNSITLPKEILDSVNNNNTIALDSKTTSTTSTTSTTKKKRSKTAPTTNTMNTMSVKCSLFNFNSNTINEMHVDCLHIVPKGKSLLKSFPNQPIIPIDEIPYDPHDNQNMFSNSHERNGFESDYFKLLPGVYDYNPKLFGF